MLGRIIRRLSREFWALLPKLNPEKELGGLSLCFGSQWWSVTRQTFVASLSIANSSEKVNNYFRSIECSDESFFATLFYRTSKNPNLSETTHVNWVGRGLVKHLELHDMSIIANSGKFFARKCGVPLAINIEKELNS